MAATKPTSRGSASGGRLRSIAAVCAFVFFQALHVQAEQPTTNPTVSEHDGVYTVTARFLVDQPVSAALAVLTDYEQIPRFLPDVRISIVLERSNGRAVVEQEAIASMMMFTKRVHLILEIQEERDALVFRDRCGKSFARYEGSWRFSTQGAQTAIVYELVAEPKFDVPGWMLKRLLRRDATQMIERLRKEIDARGARDHARLKPSRSVLQDAPDRWSAKALAERSTSASAGSRCPARRAG